MARDKKTLEKLELLKQINNENTFIQNTHNSNEICRRDAKTLDYNEFYWHYMHQNWPVIITNVASDWECRQNWILANKQNVTVDNHHCTTAINFDYLKSRIGDCQVPVADCNKLHFNSHAKSNFNFFTFLEHWRNQCNETINCNTQTITATTKSNNLYLKDWHLKAALPNYDFYNVPKQFASDWLNEHLINKERDDYRFVYMGPKDTWTPFHSDVFGSYSWSTNILGSKKWLLLPPDEELKLSDRLGNLPFRIDELLLKEHNVRFFTIFQNDNEAIFVPSGWYHQVWNLTDTISINHNWFNACNLVIIWHNLHKNMQQVITEIADCRSMDNFDEHCQTMLRASFGTNYLDFIELLEHIAVRRFDGLKNIMVASSVIILFDKYTLNEYHMQYDLITIYRVLEMILQDHKIADNCALFYRRCMSLQKKINESIFKE